MELNREQIVKDLQEIVENYSGSWKRFNVLDNALSLINELTAENERLRGVGIPDEETYIRLSDAKKAIMDYIGEQTVSKYATADECKAARYGAEGAMNELDYVPIANFAPKADTERKMQVRLEKHIFLPSLHYLTHSAVGYATDQVAKEMLDES